MSKKSPLAGPKASFGTCGRSRSGVQMYTRRLGSPYGRERINTPLTTVKIAVFAPMPRASVSTATIVKPGFLRSIRTPYFRSCKKLSTLCLSRPNHSHSLIVTQSRNRIDLRGAPCRYVAGKERDGPEPCNYRCKSGGIAGAHFEQQT